MADLFAGQREKARREAEPLAARLRPRTLAEVVGQRHILGPGKLLRRMLDAGTLTSVIFHGPPGTGKTTLAEVIANHLDRHFERENAAAVGVARIRAILDEAEARLASSGRKTVLFLDEIHRFSKSQQDVLLADVERGLITLIGATTENPMFALNSALISRSTVFRFEPLSIDEVMQVLRRALADPGRGYGRLTGASPPRLVVSDDALSAWAVASDGDARRALSALEVAVLSARGQEPVVIGRAEAEESIQRKLAVYDARAGGDQHYDVISAFIKSVRASDPDAALYWLARMLEGGEDPRFIARRLAILASEDIGNADPRALSLCAAAWELVERIGMPEARITLAQATTYLALAPKSNASYAAIEAALDDVRQGRTVAVPVPLRDRHAPRSEGSPVHGAGYRYTHTEGALVPGYGPVGGSELPVLGPRYYRPTEHGQEAELRTRLEAIRAALGLDGARGDQPDETRAPD
ncbi:MAG TPA: replication-associated recombination protein A [Phycisphaerales bacterium]|nr:replication-associated recombination protein A [Phycisphaerales bacterium]